MLQAPACITLSLTLSLTFLQVQVLPQGLQVRWEGCGTFLRCPRRSYGGMEKAASEYFPKLRLQFSAAHNIVDYSTQFVLLLLLPCRYFLLPIPFKT